MREIPGHWSSISVGDRICACVLLATAAVPFRLPVLAHSISVFDASLALLFIPWLLAVRRVGPPRVPLPYLFLGLGMVTMGVLSLLWSTDRIQTLLYTATCAEGILAFCMVMTFLRNVQPAGFIRLAQGWLLLLVIPGILMWLHVPGFAPPGNLDPSSGDYISYLVRFSHPFIGRSNNLAALLLLLVVPVAAWAMRTRRVPDIVVAVVGELAFMLTLSRGAFVALLAGLGLYLVLEKVSRRAVFASLLWSLPVAALAALIGWLNPPTRMYFASRLNDDNVTARIDLLQTVWNGLLEMWTARPSIDGRGLPRWLTGGGGGTGTDVHNTYLQQVLYFGPVLGTLIVVALAATGVWWFRDHPHTVRVTARLHGIGVVALLISLLFESSFEGSLLLPLIWIGWGLLVVSALRPTARTEPWSSLLAAKPGGYRRR